MATDSTSELDLKLNEPVENVICGIWGIGIDAVDYWIRC